MACSEARRGGPLQPRRPSVLQYYSTGARGKHQHPASSIQHQALKLSSGFQPRAKLHVALDTFYKCNSELHIQAGHLFPIAPRGQRQMLQHGSWLSVPLIILYASPAAALPSSAWRTNVSSRVCNKYRPHTHTHTAEDLQPVFISCFTASPNITHRLYNCSSSARLGCVVYDYKVLWTTSLTYLLTGRNDSLSPACQSGSPFSFFLFPFLPSIPCASNTIAAIPTLERLARPLPSRCHLRRSCSRTSTTLATGNRQLCDRLR